MSENSDRKSTLKSASAMGDDPSLRLGSVLSSSSSTSSSTKRSKKRRKRDAKKIKTSESPNETNPMGYTKIKNLLAIEDTTKFMEHLELTKTSFIMQFETKIKLGLDHLGCIADCLILIQALPEPQKRYWCTLIDEKIAEFLKIQVIPNVIPELKLSPLLFEKFKNYHKINEYFRKLNVNENYQLVQPTSSVQLTTSARVNAPIENVPMDEDALEDFRIISIIPTTSDILGVAPFIEKNILNGKYDNINHYLDVQFRLFREDCIQPLRNDIKQYQRYSKLTEKQDFSINRVKLYRGIKMCDARLAQNGFICQCTFSAEQLAANRSKALMAGTLVCFSANSYEHFFFATVNHASPEDVYGGRFKFKVYIEGTTSMPDCDMLYDMIESPVYFEAYRHNLKVLQDLNENNFPFKKYIVDVDKCILPPSYLSENPVYTISNGVGKSNPESSSFTMNILSNEARPPFNDLNMDQSQYAAYFGALTKQLAIIQGPPGTGKTHLGVRIVDALLANAKTPILITCYTNHALDQFLEGILKYCAADGDIVRIGKSKCEALDKCQLSSIKSANKRVRTKAERMKITQQRNGILNEVKLIKQTILNLEVEVNYNTIVGNEIMKIISDLNPSHLSQLQDEKAKEIDLTTSVLNWLGYRVHQESLEESNENIANDSNDSSTDADSNLHFDEEYFQTLRNQLNIDDTSNQFDDDVNHHKKLSGPINLNNVVPMDHGHQRGINSNERNSFKQQIIDEIKKSDTMSDLEARAVTDVNGLCPKDRWKLYRLWLKIHLQQLRGRIDESQNEYRSALRSLTDLNNHEDIDIAKKAKIIGMTTTGAAKNRHIIDGTRPKITIIEEAAEVFEAQIVTSLCSDADHLILLGDHLQLRPKPSVYELAKKFKLEISLFERLIKNEMPFYQLKQQHRMRPSISSLLVPHIYKELLNHPSVLEYEDIKGISKNVFFIKHGENEMASETMSHLNKHEAEFIIELARYIVLQGWDTKYLTVLTTYTGQLQLINDLLKKEQLLKGMRTSTVDNYQGEENEIVLVSFVRSNEVGGIGFLKDENRLNVALSRARKGLYCIGNFDNFARASKIWKNILDDLERRQLIGTSLEIYCQNHVDCSKMVSSKNDFRLLASYGGCQKACGSRMPCGHVCEKACHVIDQDHMNEFKKCEKPCRTTICALGHTCSEKCHDGKECGKCNFPMKKVHPQCKHVLELPCSENPALVNCSSPCKRTRPCGHKCKRLCSQECVRVPCNEQIEAISPCGHKVHVKCSQKDDFLGQLDACTEPCGIELKCGHLCKGSCGRCKLGRLHISCNEKCTQTLICGHPCTDTCSIDCTPCRVKCTNSCVHSKCPLRCGDPCTPCKEECTWRCEHLQCTKLCSEPCDRELCDHPNTQLQRNCGHPSIGVCGEKMPKLCRVCNKDEVEEIFFGNEDESDARFIELEDCKHIIEVNGLMRWMKSEPDSNSDSNANNNSQNSIQFKRCPKCQTIIRHTESLNTFTQASLHDIQQVKLTTCGSPAMNSHTQRILFEKVRSILQHESFDRDPFSLESIYKDIYHEVKPDQKMNRRNHHLSFAKPKSNQALTELNNKFKLVERLREIYIAFDESRRLKQNVSMEAIEQFDLRLRMAVAFVRQYKNCEQQRTDISNEISFLQLMNDVIVQESGKPSDEEGQKWLNVAFKVANNYGAVTDSIRNQFKEIVTDALKKFSRIGISLEEKEMVLNAMGLSRGHWYKCPNGHVYAIGDCGGATHESKCPECGSSIGGGQHRLRDDNSVATEMDGATAPAWPPRD